MINPQSPAGVGHAVSVFCLTGVLVAVKQLRNVCQTLLSISFREELKIL